MRKLLGCTRKIARVFCPTADAKSSTRVRFVVPTSRSVVPERAMISGMRKPSPISISSPRETSVSPPAANSFSVKKIAAALLLTTSDEAPKMRSSSAPA